MLQGLNLKEEIFQAAEEGLSEAQGTFKRLFLHMHIYRWTNICEYIDMYITQKLRFIRSWCQTRAYLKSLSEIFLRGHLTGLSVTGLSLPPGTEEQVP